MKPTKKKMKAPTLASNSYGPPKSNKNVANKPIVHDTTVRITLPATATGVRRNGD